MKKTFLALALALASSFQAGAAQILFQGSPTESISATVSRSEPNLLKVEGRKIKRIYGTEGLFTVTPEAETGAAWLKPLTDKPLMSVFITDDTGQHFKILLKVEDIPAETLILRGRDEHVKNMGSLKDEPRNDLLVNFVKALHDGEGDPKNTVIPLWKGVRFELVKVLELHSLTGSSFLLSNTSEKQIVIDEREFYRDGVQAVSVKKPALEPGETTQVFVISEEE